MRLWGLSHSNITVPSPTEEKLQNTPLQRLKGGNTTGLPTGRLVIHCRGFIITFKPHHQGRRMANPKTNCGKKTVNPLALELDINSSAHHLCKTCIFYEPRRVTLGNTLYLVEG